MSIFTVTVLLMMKQIEWHGKPIDSGFLEAFIIKGGSIIAYQNSKYLKIMISCLTMIAAVAVLITGQKFYVFGFWPIAIAWAIVHPLYIMFWSNACSLNNQAGYEVTQSILNFQMVLIGFLAVVSAGVVAKSQAHEAIFFKYFVWT